MIENQSSYLLSEGDKEDITLFLSDEVLRNNLEEQLSESDILNYLKPNNFLDIFDERLNYLNAKYLNDAELIQKFKDVKLEIYLKVCKGIEKKFNIKTNFSLAYTPMLNYFFYIKKLYNFFVINYRENLVNFFINYILNHKNELAKVTKNNTNKKDLTIESLKKILVKPEDVIITHNLEDIVNLIVETLEDNNLIIKTIISSDEEESTNIIIKELFLENKENSYLENEFRNNFFKPIKDENQAFDLISEIKLSFFSLLEKKQK
jgi:hypothetical protein